jgi:hypothetical protein
MTIEVPQPSARRQSLQNVLILALAAVAILLAYWYWSSRQNLAEESDAAKALQELGAIVVMDGGRRHVASVNLSTLQSSEVLAKALEHLPKLTQLTSLDASRTAISDDQLKFLAELTSLSSLSLNSTDVTDEGLRRLRSLTSLESLFLASTGIANRSLPFIADLSELRILDVSATKVTGNLEPLARLPQLEWLVLRKLSLEDEALPKLAGCEALKRLSLEESKYAVDSLATLQRDIPGLTVDR